MENENSNVEKTNALNIADVASSAYIKNFGDVKRFKITDEIKQWAKEQYEKSDKTEFLKIINGQIDFQENTDMN
jgi:hypothetical protein